MGSEENAYFVRHRFSDRIEAYKKYESLMNQGPQTENQTNIPGGVSQTSQLASGEDMGTASPGMEELTS